MLAPLVYSLLARKDLADDKRRAFLVLVSEYDLSEFHAIDIPYVDLKYDFHDCGIIIDSIRFFCAVGILEAGPRVSFRSTYRIRPEFLLTAGDLRAFEREAKDRRAREALAIL